MIRRRHLSLITSGRHPLTREEHDRQRKLVEASMYRSARSQERRDEARAYARIYPFPRTRVDVAPQNPPTRPAA